MYGGVYPEDKQWYRCRIKKLIEDDKVTLSCSQLGISVCFELDVSVSGYVRFL